MAWTNILNAAVAVGGIPSSTTVTALRDNFGGMAAAETGAPVIFAGWHPYNKLTVGDGETGLVYSHAVNGTQATVTLPDFEDGYEYRVICRDMSHNSGTSQTCRVGFFDAGDSLLDGVESGSYSSGTNDIYMDVIVALPRVIAERTPIFVLGRGVVAGNYSVETDGEKIQRAKVYFSAGSIDGGRIWLLRQREYISLP
jgi:hypothetical protein